MSQIQKKHRKSTTNATNGFANLGAEVLTLPEAAAYLRVREADLLRLAQNHDLPGRLIGDEWRFLKSALADWLRSPLRPGSWEAVMSAAGAWKEDPYVEAELKEIYRQRGRPITEDGE